jgi:hypothetical protein
MKQRVASHLIGLAVVLLWGAGISRAGFQAKERVYWLGTGDLELCEKPEGAYLVESPRDRWDRVPSGLSRWSVSAPTIQSPSGKFLAGDPEGRNPTVHLVGEKGANARWVFEFASPVRPGRSREGPYKEGPSGFTFRVKLAEGPFKDWYLAAEERRCLKLVPDLKEATVFTYIEENYYVGHK